MTTVVMTRKWGNSIGIVLPKELVQEQRLKANERVSIVLIKHLDFRPLFGSLPRKMSGQNFKDLARSGWER